MLRAWGTLKLGLTPNANSTQSLARKASHGLAEEHCGSRTILEVATVPTCFAATMLLYGEQFPPATAATTALSPLRLVCCRPRPCRVKSMRETIMQAPADDSRSHPKDTHPRRLYFALLKPLDDSPSLCIVFPTQPLSQGTSKKSSMLISQSSSQRVVWELFSGVPGLGINAARPNHA